MTNPGQFSATFNSAAFSRGALFHLLRNRTYLGEIPHKTTSHPGLHEAIIPQDLFDAVQARLDAQKTGRGNDPADHGRAPLTGRIFDADGHPMSPTTARGRSGRSYRYYVSAPLQQGRAHELLPGKRQQLPQSPGSPKRTGAGGNDRVAPLRRVASDAIEARISEIVTRLLPGMSGDPLQIPQRIELHAAALHLLLPLSLRPTIEAHLRPDEVLQPEDGITMTAASGPLDVQTAPGSKKTGRKKAGATASPGLLRLSCPIGLHRRGGRTEVTAISHDGPRADPTLIRALRTAHAMVARDAKGLPLIGSAPTSPHQRRLVRLAFLAPELQTAILNGRQPRDLTLARLMEADIPLCWTAQAQMFGTGAP